MRFSLFLIITFSIYFFNFAVIINFVFMQTRCHLSVLIHEQAKKYGNRQALIFRNFGRRVGRGVMESVFR